MTDRLVFRTSSDGRVKCTSVRFFRHRLGWTQQRLEAELGCGGSRVSKWELPMSTDDCVSKRYSERLIEIAQRFFDVKIVRDQGSVSPDAYREEVEDEIAEVRQLYSCAPLAGVSFDDLRCWLVNHGNLVEQICGLG